MLRFLQHVLPKRFTKIRHYGFLSTRSKGVDLPRIRKALKVNNPPAKKKLSSREVMLETQGKDPYICPKCQLAELVVVEVFPGIRGSPPRFLRRIKSEIGLKNLSISKEGYLCPYGNKKGKKVF